MRRKRSKSAKTIKPLSRRQLELQRINFAFGNAPEGAQKWVTRKSLEKAATDRIFLDKDSDLQFS